jgi:hypothetical protein
MDSLESDAWVGRQQAFALIASKCSATQAHALKEIKESRAFEQLGLTWEEFCLQHVGLRRERADALIHQFDEFGEDYFRLSQIAGFFDHRVVAMAQVRKETSRFEPQ